MKNNFRRLQMLIKIFGADKFFCCEATGYSVICLAKFNPSLLSAALKYRFKLAVTTSGYIALTRGAYSITLTD
jgi:hypothetical protein